MKKLQKDFEDHWAGLSDSLNETCDMIIGSDKEKPTTLTGFEWYSGTPWDQPQVRKGFKRNGPWIVEVLKDGVYTFNLHRWPSGLNTPIRAAGPAVKALPVHYALLQIGDFDQTIQVKDSDIYARFEVSLKACKGKKITTWFMDQDQNELCGAYYLTVEQK